MISGPPLERIYALDAESGVWHVARETFPNTASTACGIEEVRVSIFTTDRNLDRANPIPRKRCSACEPS